MKAPIVSFSQHTHTAPLLVKYLEAASILGGVSMRYVEGLVAKKKLKTVGQGKARRILYSSIVTYIEKEAS